MTFVSGWSGFREIFDKIPSQGHFFVPFVDFFPNQTPHVISTEKELLIGWSLGAHLILKYALHINAKKVLLFAPFLYFCDHVNKRILDRMILAFEKDKSKVVSEFLQNIGARSYNKNIPDSLKDGLEFLKVSKVENFEKKDNYICVCARYDFLNLANACDKICKKSIIVNSNHYFSEDTINGIIQKLH
ncbi:MAG TPA: hypothetical protein ENM99_03600 [Desulfurella acetivorans]|uniref:Alpha/beta hydrolase n=1 Tax=Desulfurella acetivorans TaxID=33002 RepID=A0A7C6E8K1_DESAE|nr:hypothetical protein [Desulfurella acetivorans]